MSKTTAKVEFRDFVPYGVIAVEYCHVHFYGPRAKKMQKLWDDIEYERYAKYNPVFEKNEELISSMEEKASSILEEVKKSKPFYRFWYNKKEKEMISEANELLNQAYNLEIKNREIGKNRFFSAFEARFKLKYLLVDNGFVLTSVSGVGDECITITEIWTLEE